MFFQQQYGGGGGGGGLRERQQRQQQQQYGAAGMSQLEQYYQPFSTSSEESWRDEDPEVIRSMTEQFYIKHGVKTFATYALGVCVLAAVLFSVVGAIEGVDVWSFNYVKAVVVLALSLLFASSTYGKLIRSPPLSPDDKKKSDDVSDDAKDKKSKKKDEKDKSKKSKQELVRDYIYKGVKDAGKGGKDDKRMRTMMGKKGSKRLEAAVKLVKRHVRILKENAPFIATTALCGVGATVAYFALMCRVSNPTLKSSDVIHGEGPWSIFIGEMSHSSQKTIRFLSSDGYAVVVSGLFLGIAIAIRKIYSEDYYLSYAKSFVTKKSKNIYIIIIIASKHLFLHLFYFCFLFFFFLMALCGNP